MSGVNKLLLLDVGNTRIKFATVSNLVIDESGAIEQATDLLLIIDSVQTCYISAVGQKQRVSQIEKVLKNKQIDVRQIATQAEFHGLTCAYQNPSRLGIDRWLAMLACRKKYTGNFAVLDFGTAMTCDVVSSVGTHLGGWIAPGFRTMQVALLQETENLRVEEDISAELFLGTDTAACINQGILAAMQGFLISTQRQMQQKFTEYRIFIGGGNNHLLEQCIDDKSELLEELVLDGMLTFIECELSLNS